MFKRLLACVVMIAALTSAVHAQRFPDRLIRIIVPFTPGGSNDIVALELAAGFQERFKQYAVVENRPGGGAIAYTGIAKSPPDGYSLLIAPVFPIKAAEFIACGVPHEPALGVALRLAEEAWIEADFPSYPKAVAGIALAATVAAKA